MKKTNVISEILGNLFGIFRWHSVNTSTKVPSTIFKNANGNFVQQLITQVLLNGF